MPGLLAGAALTEALRKIPEAKLKLLDSSLANLADVAKNAAPLDEMFGKMRESSLLMAPYNIFLDKLGAETTRLSADSVGQLLGTLSSPATQLAIDALAGSFTSLTNEAAIALVSINNIASSLIRLGNSASSSRVKTKATFNDLLDHIDKFLAILFRLSQAMDDLGDRREGMGEGFVPGPGGGTYEGGGGR